VVTVAPRNFATVVFRNNDTACIRVDQNFSRIEAHAICGIGGAFNSIPVYLARFHIGHEYMPVVIRMVSEGIDASYTRRPRIVNFVEEEQFHACGMLRVYAEVCPFMREGRSQRKTSSLLKFSFR